VRASCLKVVVVGKGIVGSSFAWWLSLAGAEVTVVARDESGHDESATPCSWAWINAGRFTSPEYSRFRHSSSRIWDEILTQIPEIPVSGGGSLIWDQPRQELEMLAASLNSLGRGCELLEGGEIKAAAPYLRHAPSCALLIPSDRAIEPVHAAAALLKASGASVVDARVEGLAARGSKITGVLTASEVIQADEVVVAAGLGSQEILRSVGSELDLNSTIGVLGYSSPVPKFLGHLLIGPEVHVRQDWKGRLVAGGKFDGLSSEMPTRKAARQQLRSAKSILDCEHEIVLENYTVGRRVIPADGLPKIGRVRGFSGLFLAVMHSGMTNAAAAGKFGAAEIITGTRDALLNPFQP